MDVGVKSRTSSIVACCQELVTAKTQDSMFSQSAYIFSFNPTGHILASGESKLVWWSVFTSGNASSSEMQTNKEPMGSEV